ncbi:MAG TPA: hypothetical protein VHV54_14250 [Candidatus Binatia bacterium]|nr:hypothetical protein [Candidatus Binatia bacterium]
MKCGLGYGELSVARVDAQGGRCVHCHPRVVPGWHDALHRGPFCAAHSQVADRDPGYKPAPQQDIHKQDRHRQELADKRGPQGNPSPDDDRPGKRVPERADYGGDNHG